MAEVPHLLADATTEALRRHAPFDRMDARSLEFLAGKLVLAYFAKGRQIAAPEDGVSHRLYIIQRGLVRGEHRAGVAPGPDVVEYSSGECFPLAEVTARRPASHVYTAEEDSFCYEMRADDVEELSRLSEPFREFCASSVGALLQQAQASLQAAYAMQSAAQQPLISSLREVLRKAPVCCSRDASLQSALETMQRARVGSIVVVDEAGRPLGIFTERDLLRYAARGGIEWANAIEAYMTLSPACLPSTATAADAAMLMARVGIRHVPVVEEGRLVGVVSERDLFSLQRTSMLEINHSIDAAADLQGLRHAAALVRDLASNMTAQGMGAEHVTELIAVLNDKLAQRVIDLEFNGHKLGGVRLCWIALGSEGRLEQTLATDQDNGIIFSSDFPAGETRERLLPFGRSVNRTLDACGFPLCRGDIMAGNPHWCLSLEEWQEKFDNWIRNPLPQALLHSSIFFDFRALWGEASLANRLRGWLIPRVKDNQRFLRAMAESALQWRPALGVFRQITVTRAADASASVDLKAHGTRPFVDAARIYALAAGLEQTNTSARLRLSGDRLGLPREEVESMVAAFHFVLLFRMRHQQLAPGKDPNRIDPESLNDIDRRILKAAFMQARMLQSRLALDFQL